MSDQSSEPGASDGNDGPGRGNPDRRTWIVVGVLAVVVVGLLVWLWAAGDDGEDIAGTLDTTTTSTGDPGSTDSTVGSSTTAPGSAGETPPDESADALAPPEDASTAPVSVPYPDIDQTGLVDVRTAAHEGFDRVTFEFDGAIPGYEVRYADKPITESGSGKEVPVDGPFVVTVRMAPASGVRLTNDGYEEIYPGPDRIPGSGEIITEIVESGDFEGQTTWAVGLAEEVDFAVSTLESPSRLVVDFVHQ